MPCASYQCSSATRTAPPGRRIRASPFMFRQCPWPYKRRKRERSRIPEPAAMASTSQGAHRISKSTRPSIYRRPSGRHRTRADAAWRTHTSCWSGGPIAEEARIPHRQRHQMHQRAFCSPHHPWILPLASVSQGPLLGHRNATRAGCAPPTARRAPPRRAGRPAPRQPSPGVAPRRYVSEDGGALSSSVAYRRHGARDDGNRKF